MNGLRFQVARVLMVGAGSCAVSACGTSDVCTRRPRDCEGPADAQTADGGKDTTDDDGGLPDPFRFEDGTRVSDQEDWRTKREQLAEQIQTIEYGHLPTPSYAVSVNAEEQPLDDEAAEEIGSVHQLEIEVEADDTAGSFSAMMYLPQGDAPFAAFVTPGFSDIVRELFLSRGYAVVQFSINEVAADNAGNNGLFFTLHPEQDTAVLMAWAWGYHRVIDALEQIEAIDAEQVIVTGHSRYGKAALVAGAFDERVAITMPTSSGLAGVGNFRFLYGDSESLDSILGFAPYWFADELQRYRGRADELPFDQHSVMALVAPRALMASTGTEDAWTNPRGCQLSYQAARKVYEFLEVPDRIGIHFRPGSHGLTAQDYLAMLEFADWHLRGEESVIEFDELPYPETPEAIPWDVP